MRAFKQFNISKQTIERNIKNDDSIIKITYTHISKNYIIIIMYDILCSYLYNIIKACIKSLPFSLVMRYLS